jgi:rod shape-determining protein MreD
MRFFFYIAICLGLVVCQTSLIPRLPAMGNFFDLLVPLVVYLAAFRPLHESVPFVMFLGMLMDNLSGGPFGLYLTSYVWLLIGVRPATSVIRADNPILLVTLIMAGVLLQNVIFFGALAAAGPSLPHPGDALRVITEQIGWVLLFGPFLAVFMRHARRFMGQRRRRADAGRPAAAR